LQITFKELEDNRKDSTTTVAIDSKRVLFLMDSITTSLIHKGFLNLVALQNNKINDTLHSMHIVLHRKYTHMAVTKKHSFEDKKILHDSLFSKEPSLIAICDIPKYLTKQNETVIRQGYPFAQTKLSHLTFTDSDTVAARLQVTLNNKRYMNRIIVKGYNSFPKQLVSDFTSQKQLYNKKTLVALEQRLKNIPFIKKTKETEVLFKKDSTVVFIYLEKLPINTGDGMIGFNNKTNSKLELNGYINLKLQNNLNKGETFLLRYRNDNGDQTQLSTRINLPYLWRTNIGVNSSIEIQRRDSTYQRTTLNAGLFYKPNWYSNIGITYAHINSTATGSDVNTKNFTKDRIEIQAGLIKQTTDRLMPENLLIRASLGISNRALQNSMVRQFNFRATILKLWHLNRKNTFLNELTSCYLQSDSIKFNELYQFGGLGSIRGFNQNSIDSSFYTTLATEYRHRLNDQIYVHSILDIGIFENFNSKTLDKIYGYGVGIAILTQAGVLNLSIANGRFENAKVDLSSTVAHINLQIIF
jgi:hypothetical protein